MPPSEASAPGIDREEQPGVAQVFVELLARDARLDRGVEIFGVDPQHAVHLRQIDADAALQCRDMALQRGAGAEGDHRRLVLRAEPDDRRDFLGALREGHRVGGVRLMIGLVLAVLLADRSRGR